MKLSPSPSSSPSKSSQKYLEHLKTLNSAKKENQELKHELRNLNKSLDKIIKSCKTPLRTRFLEKAEVSESEIHRKVESTENLISKYKKEVDFLKINKISIELEDKQEILSSVLQLEENLKTLENENLKLKQNEKKFKRFDGVEAKKVIQDYRDKCRDLNEIISRDEKIITGFKEKVLKTLKIPKNEDKFWQDSDFIIQGLIQQLNDLETQKNTEEAENKQKISQLTQQLLHKTQEAKSLESTLQLNDKICRVKRMKIKAKQRENRNLIKDSLIE